MGTEAPRKRLLRRLLGRLRAHPALQLGDDAEQPAAERPPGGPPIRLAVLLIALAATLAATGVANTLWPLLLRDHPLMLPALDGRNRYLLLASAKVGMVQLAVVGISRRTAGHIVYYLLGHWYGEAALRWTTRRSRLWARALHRTRRVLPTVAAAAVLLTSSNIARTVAGATGTRPVRFALLEAIGTVLQFAALFVFVRSVGNGIAGPVGVLDRHTFWLTAATLLIGCGWALWRTLRRRRRRIRSRRESADGV